MKTAIRMTLAVLIFSSIAWSQQCKITDFIVEPGPDSSSCILAYTFTNGTAKKVHHLYIDLPSKTKVSVTQLPGTAQFTQISPKRSPISDHWTRYSWVTNNSTVPMNPTEQVTVRIQLNGISKAQYLQAIANQPSQLQRFSRFPIFTQGAAGSRNTNTKPTQKSRIYEEPGAPGFQTPGPGSVPVYGPPAKGVKLSAFSLGNPGEVPFLIDVLVEAFGYGNQSYVMLASFDSLPGINAGGLHIHANLDPLAVMSLDPTNGIMQDFQGVIDPVWEEAAPYILVPQVPALSGFQFNLACVVVNQQLNGLDDTNELPFTITL